MPDELTLITYADIIARNASLLKELVNNSEINSSIDCINNLIVDLIDLRTELEG